MNPNRVWGLATSPSCPPNKMAAENKFRHKITPSSSVKNPISFPPKSLSIFASHWENVLRSAFTFPTFRDLRYVVVSAQSFHQLLSLLLGSTTHYGCSFYACTAMLNSPHYDTVGRPTVILPTVRQSTVGWRSVKKLRLTVATASRPRVNRLAVDSRLTVCRQWSTDGSRGLARVHMIREMYEWGSESYYVNYLSPEQAAMESQVIHSVWCYISGEAAEEIWNWSLLGEKGLIYLVNVQVKCGSCGEDGKWNWSSSFFYCRCKGSFREIRSAPVNILLVNACSVFKG